MEYQTDQEKHIQRCGQCGIGGIVLVVVVGRRTDKKIGQVAFVACIVFGTPANTPFNLVVRERLSENMSYYNIFSAYWQYFLCGELKNIYCVTSDSSIHWVWRRRDVFDMENQAMAVSGGRCIAGRKNR